MKDFHVTSLTLISSLLEVVSNCHGIWRVNVISFRSASSWDSTRSR